ncbi:hypothetical protein [Xanthomonas hortorum]|uniref:Uncharacterized protein n=2 Tax=Xanthomonas hortorum TaxID=56454 RepID=A0A9X4BWU4_9XANT|nr:hypothetical protein [Xanthomonas hortorum]MDC8640868.1 hypothetical protein [Xanthomonas hortorum pv. hederae]
MTGAFPRNLIGEIQGPGRPLPGSLTWTVGGELVLAWGEFFATFDGFESKDVNKGFSRHTCKNDSQNRISFVKT